VIRLILFLAIAAGLAYCGATVKLGKRTFFGHVRAIWHTEEVQDLKEGVKDTAGPTVDRVERGIHAGVKAMSDDGSATTRDAGTAHEVPAH
jgi:chloramphenicol 3-O-phosphotransferase